MRGFRERKPHTILGVDAALPLTMIFGVMAAIGRPGNEAPRNMARKGHLGTKRWKRSAFAGTKCQPKPDHRSRRRKAAHKARMRRRRAA